MTRTTLPGAARGPQRRVCPAGGTSIPLPTEKPATSAPRAPEPILPRIEAKALGSASCEACSQPVLNAWWVLRAEGPSEVLCPPCLRDRLSDGERASLIARARWLLGRIARSRRPVTPKSVLVADGQVIGPLDVGDTSRDE